MLMLFGAFASVFVVCTYGLLVGIQGLGSSGAQRPRADCGPGNCYKSALAMQNGKTMFWIFAFNCGQDMAFTAHLLP
jgi:hypothetical protein